MRDFGTTRDRVTSTDSGTNRIRGATRHRNTNTVRWTNRKVNLQVCGSVGSNSVYQNVKSVTCLLYVGVVIFMMSCSPVEAASM